MSFDILLNKRAADVGPFLLFKFKTFEKSENYRNWLKTDLLCEWNFYIRINGGNGEVMGGERSRLLVLGLACQMSLNGGWRSRGFMMMVFPHIEMFWTCAVELKLDQMHYVYCTWCTILSSKIHFEMYWMPSTVITTNQDSLIYKYRVTNTHIDWEGGRGVVVCVSKNKE